MKQKMSFFVFVIVLAIVYRTGPVLTTQAQSTPILVLPNGKYCGPNSVLEDAGLYTIDWGGDELEFKQFSLIQISTYIDPQVTEPQPQMQLQFVANPLPATLSSEITGEAPYGARLYQATYGTMSAAGYTSRQLLYNNKKNGAPFAKPTNVGRADEGVPFIAFAGVETAYPSQEHGLYANVQWLYSIRCEKESELATARWVFRAFGPSSENGNSEADFVLKTFINSGSWVQEIEDVKPTLDYMFYTNVMIPSGGQQPNSDLVVDRIEVVAEEIDEVMLHSSTGSPWGIHTSGGINEYGSARFDDPNRVNSFDWHLPNQYDGKHGILPKSDSTWVGWFIKNGKNYAEAFDNLINHMVVQNHDQEFQIQFASGQGFYPKLFCGPTLTVDWSDDKLAYCEVWLSPNAPSFWHGPSGLDAFAGFSLTFTPNLISEGTQPLNRKTYLPLVFKVKSGEG